MNLEALIDKYEDALACADSLFERDLWMEMLDDLRTLKKTTHA